MNRLAQNAQKIAVVHTKASWYRMPLFDKLSSIFDDIWFLFTQPHELPVYTRKGKGAYIERLRFPQDMKVKLFKQLHLLPPPYAQTVSPGVIIDIIKERYDIVVWGGIILSVECWLSFLLLKLFGKKFIIWSDEWGSPKPLARRLLSPIMDFIARHSDAILVPGTRHKLYFVSIGAGEARVFVSGCASLMDVKEEDAEAAEVLRQSLQLKGKKVILYVGGFIEVKGIDVLIRAFSILGKEMDVSLVLVGDGYLWGKLQALCAEKAVENDVHFTGYVMHQKLTPYYLVSNVFVLPSLLLLPSKRRGEVGGEAWGMVLNEAMSVSKPVIATDAVGGAYDLIKNGRNGFIIRSGDAKSLYVALKTILICPEIEKKMGEESKNIVWSSFTYERMAGVFQEAILYAIKPKS